MGLNTRKRSASLGSDAADGSPPTAKGTKQQSKRAKTAKTTPQIGVAQKDSEGNDYFTLSKGRNERRVAISQFKDQTLISIREYYEKDGKSMPGKKGISLTKEQFSALITCLPNIEAVLSSKGESLPRPSYDEAPAAATSEPKPDSGGEPSKPPKKNIEATSDEDEESEA
ncbi:transcriptional Coactivator p15-domain-containing protein [Lineolata rhizophorae]|uniref:Transcriptional Coactivator p15-domain-containing protein n=1 Tax=Lineolata rhizophorae TaxID=578093 RepID=A0A6A6P110_9PEZI|nr:transcriptional Coactivator p15-domain-containing protein [Lineolata rhizophorae]